MMNHPNKNSDSFSSDTDITTSVRDQLAALDEAEDSNIEEEKNYKTITERMNEKKDEDVFKTPEKEKKEMDHKVKMGMLITGFIIILVIVIFAFFQIQKNNTKSNTTTAANTVNKITEKDTDKKDKQPVQSSEVNNKLEIPKEVKTEKDAVGIFSEINKDVVAYLSEMKDLVIKYNNRDRNDIYIEDLMDTYKKSLLKDIDILAKYKPIYDKFNGNDLYLVTLDRFQNAYELSRTCKNVMTEKALTNSTNNYIGKEEELNTRATTAMVSFLEKNNIEFALEDDKIVIK